MAQAGCSLELAEMVLIKHKNLEETEEIMISDSSKDASSSDVLKEPVGM